MNVIYTNLTKNLVKNYEVISMNIFVLTKDYKIVTPSETIILGKAGDQVIGSGIFYNSDFTFMVTEYNVKNRRGDIDLTYQFSVFNIDRLNIKDLQDDGYCNKYTFVVKSEDVFLLNERDKKGQIEKAKKFKNFDDGAIAGEEKSEYFVPRFNIYLLLEDFSIENEKYTLAKRGDIVVSTGSYSNLYQFEVISVSLEIGWNDIINDGIFVVNRDQVLPIPIQKNISQEVKELHWNYALQRLVAHEKNRSDSSTESQILQQRIEDDSIEYDHKGFSSRMSTGDDNEDFWNELLDSSGVPPGGEDAFFDSFHDD